jgi:hypothetical protein
VIISLGAYGRDPLEAVDPWLRVTAALESAAPSLQPEWWIYDEPRQRRWAGDDSVRAAAESGDLHARLRGGGDLLMARKTADFICHTQVTVNTPAAGDLDQAALAGLLRQLAGAVDANYAFLHLLHPPAWEGNRLPYAVDLSGRGDMELVIPPWLLELYLPNVYWGTVLGPDYVDLFGAARLAGAPCAVVEEFEPGRWYLQATERLSDCADAHDRYASAADAVMDHLGRQAFVDPAGYRQPGLTPDFSHLRAQPPPRPYVAIRP